MSHHRSIELSEKDLRKRILSEINDRSVIECILSTSERSLIVLLIENYLKRIEFRFTYFQVYDHLYKYIYSFSMDDSFTQIHSLRI